MSIRLATTADALPCAEFTHDVRQDTVPLVHDIPEIESWICTHLIPRGSCWVLELDGEIVGWVDVYGTDLNQLYLKRGFQNRGFGKALLDHAKQLSPGTLELFTFQVNHGARQFYQREGFTEVAWSSGQDNEEGEPDVKLAWSAAGDELT